MRQPFRDETGEGGRRCDQHDRKRGGSKTVSQVPQNEQAEGLSGGLAATVEGGLQTSAKTITMYAQKEARDTALKTMATLPLSRRLESLTLGETNIAVATTAANKSPKATS